MIAAPSATSHARTNLVQNPRHRRTRSVAVDGATRGRSPHVMYVEAPCARSASRRRLRARTAASRAKLTGVLRGVDSAISEASALGARECAEALRFALCDAHGSDLDDDARAGILDTLRVRLGTKLDAEIARFLAGHVASQRQSLVLRVRDWRAVRSLNGSLPLCDFSSAA